MRPFFLILCLTAAGVAQTKTSVAVLDFKATGSARIEDVSLLTGRFRNILVATEKFEIVERERMETVLKEQDFSMSDNCSSQECAIQIGQLLGVQKMIAGDVGKLGDTWTIDLRIIDVAKGKIEQSMSKDYQGAIDGLLDVMKGMAARLAGQGESSSEEWQKSWEILSGKWYEKDGALFGSGGSLLYRKAFADGSVEFTVEKVTGPAWAALAVAWRDNLFEGGGKLYRDKTSDIQGYGFNFTFDKRFNLFSGVGGGWYLVNANWKEFQNTDLLDERVNHIRVSFKGTKSTVFVNGKELYSFTDNTHGLGSPGFWVQEPSQIIKFYDIKITPE